MVDHVVMAGPTPLAAFNADQDLARTVLATCLDVPRWVDEVSARRPFLNRAALAAAAAEVAATVQWAEVSSALDRHPRLGERKAAAPRSEAESSWSADEQSGVTTTEQQQLVVGNQLYENRFGHIFLIRAAGRSGPEILRALHQRLSHTPEREREVVISELQEIAALRLAKAVSE